jgi:hypothetical protein
MDRVGVNKHDQLTFIEFAALRDLLIFKDVGESRERTRILFPNRHPREGASLFGYLKQKAGFDHQKAQQQIQLL